MSDEAIDLSISTGWYPDGPRFAEVWAREDWSRLTTYERKFQLYVIESYFRESWHDVCDVLGESRFETLQSLALVIFKPDAIVGRRTLPGLAFFRARGFQPIAAHRIK